MELITDWKRVLRKAWSVRLLLLAGMLSGIEVVLPLFADAFTRNLFAGLSFMVVVCAMIARFVAQPKMHEGGGDGA